MIDDVYENILQCANCEGTTFYFIEGVGPECVQCNARFTNLIVIEEDNYPSWQNQPESKKH